MQLTDSLWLDGWHRSREPFTRISPDYYVPEWGSDEEPLSSCWMASLSEAAADLFREGVSVLDYGCGGGRYCNFLSGWLKDFSYYGVEVGPEFDTGEWKHPDGDTSWGSFCLRICNQYFGHDPRAKFDFINSPLEQEAINNCNLVILGSIFTHLAEKDMDDILDKLMPVVHRGGRIVFSAFIGDKYATHGLGGRGVKGYIGTVNQTWEHLCDYVTDKGIYVEDHDWFKYAGHRIISMWK